MRWDEEYPGMMCFRPGGEPNTGTFRLDVYRQGSNGGDILVGAFVWGGFYEIEE